jgi:hypothetical protein
MFARHADAPSSGKDERQADILQWPGLTPFRQGHLFVINVVRCPACPKDAKPNSERLQTKAALEKLLGDDEDGLAATFEDYRL